MTTLIVKMTTFFKNIKVWYEQRNSEQAVKTLYSQQLYLASVFSGINTFLSHFSKYGTVITTLLSTSAFLGFAMTPTIWLVVGAAMLLGGGFLALNSVDNHFNKSNQLRSDLETAAEYESKTIHLKQQIQTQYEQQDTLKK